MTNSRINFIMLDSSMMKIFRYFYSLLLDSKTYKWAGVGLVALAGDYGLYNLLLPVLDMDIAKGISTFLGLNISFNGNRLWTFKSTAGFFDDLRRYIVLYCLVLIINVSANHLAYDYFQDINLAYFAALCVSVSVGFFGQRLWVFKNRLN